MQRVAIARALGNEPSNLLADEPTGDLDSCTSVEIMQVLQGLNARGLTIVMMAGHSRSQQANATLVLKAMPGLED